MFNHESTEHQTATARQVISKAWDLCVARCPECNLQSAQLKGRQCCNPPRFAIRPAEHAQLLQAFGA
eukprot:8636226-Alexandrium_andersonii.AAC.1